LVALLTTTITFTLVKSGIPNLFTTSYHLLAPRIVNAYHFFLSSRTTDQILVYSEE